MEKHSAHYSLQAIKTEVLARKADAFTAIALNNARSMGLTGIETVGVVLSLQRTQFYKSMTTHADHRVWQDVYHALCPNGRMAYIKLTLQAGAVVIQFKER